MYNQRGPEQSVAQRQPVSRGWPVVRSGPGVKQTSQDLRATPSNLGPRGLTPRQDPRAPPPNQGPRGLPPIQHPRAPVPIHTPNIFSSYPTKPNSISKIDTFPVYYADNTNSISRIDVGPREVQETDISNPLDTNVKIQIFKFRGEDSMTGYVPPSRSAVQWSEAAVTPPPSPAPRPSTWRTEVEPPFPTRHTTSRPDLDTKPVIIIAQSSVQKMNA